MKTTYKILTLNSISVEGLQRLPRERYEVASDIGHPDAIMVRSAKMHDMPIPDTVLAVARAGAGTNNVPVAALAKRGIPVFNAPGANANAVKELVLAGMLLAARNICQAWNFVEHLKEEGAALDKVVEAGKKTYVGFELPGRTLGVVGLGAIGVQVANAAVSLGMRVVGFDPQVTVERAWQLSASVEQARSLDELFSKADFLTVHVPLLDATRSLVNEARIKLMPAKAVILNFARGEIVDESAVAAALASGKLTAYISDFPSRALIGNPKVISLPHLGASTYEAESNCAVMVADNLRAYLEHGVIRYSVNFPDADLPRTTPYRITIANANVPNMVGQISTCLGDAGLNIADLLNKSRGEVAYTIADLDGPVKEETLARIRGIAGVLSVRCLSENPA
ncbi:MAG: phosphoglycerate dehydrogenase [Gammaproteobacteria bacterium]|nr:phosphoglycerate dehydrogenase [Gammaproteobacteria bacterium]